MITLQSITGMRRGELCVMRGVDIDTTGTTTWRYEPKAHKTAHHGHDRVVELGPQAQEIITRFFKPDLSAFIFSPADAAEARRQLRREQRLTSLTCGNVPAADEQDVEREREPGDHYSPTSYRRAIARACAAAFPPPKRLERRRVQANGAQEEGHAVGDARGVAEAAGDGCLARIDRVGEEASIPPASASAHGRNVLAQGIWRVGHPHTSRRSHRADAEYLRRTGPRESVGHHGEDRLNLGL